MGEILASTFWRALLMGCGMAAAWRFVRPGPLRTTLQVTGSLLVFVPQLFIIFLLYQSVALLLYQEALLSLDGRSRGSVNPPPMGTVEAGWTDALKMATS
jgi:hypothetical protein